MNRHCLALLLCLIGASTLPAPTAAHPGSGIVVDRAGNVYIVDMVSGAWRIDASGKLTHLPGPGFHWMTLDGSDAFRQTRLPTGASGDMVRLGAQPRLLLSSDVPLAIGSDGNLYYPSRGAPLQIIKLHPTGRTSTLASLPVAGPRWLNGLAAGPDGALYYTEDRSIHRIGKDGQVAPVVSDFSCSGLAKPGPDPLLGGLDVDAGGTVYVAATGCKAVYKIAPGGRITRLPQLAAAWAPTGIARFGSQIYVLEFQRGDSEDRRSMLPRVRKITPDGRTTVVARVVRH